jgi:CubicO group peptidase (beta-lactamase class C family)
LTRNIKLCAAALVLGCGGAIAQNSADSRLESVFAPLAGGRTPGLAVLVRKDGRTVFERGYGVRDLRTLRPIDAVTDFRLASFTKQFTAMAVMLLARDGKLRYDEPITEILTGLPGYARAITVRHLLTHTGGLPDYEDAMDARVWTPENQIQDEDVLALLERQPAPKFAPGASWAYSNSGYVLLGLIVAKASGQPFGQFLEERIFHPLQMTSTLAYRNGTNTVPDRAYGHSRKDGEFVETDQSSTSATLGDGGVYSNLADLARWDAALQNHTLLSEREMSAALMPVKLKGGGQPTWPSAPGDDNLKPGKPVAYGFGWFLDPYRGRARMWHSGSTQGFRTAIERFPEEKLTVIVLSNRTDLDAAALALQAADVILDRTTEKR